MPTKKDKIIEEILDLHLEVNKICSPYAERTALQTQSIAYLTALRKELKEKKKNDNSHN